MNRKIYCAIQSSWQKQIGTVLNIIIGDFSFQTHPSRLWTSSVFKCPVSVQFDVFGIVTLWCNFSHRCCIRCYTGYPLVMLWFVGTLGVVNLGCSGLDIRWLLDRIMSGSLVQKFSPTWQLCTWCTWLLTANLKLTHHAHPWCPWLYMLS